MTLEGTVLENVEGIKHLGVTITNDLKWNAHISNVCTKVLFLQILSRSISDHHLRCGVGGYFEFSKLGETFGMGH